ILSLGAQRTARGLLFERNASAKDGRLMCVFELKGVRLRIGEVQRDVRAGVIAVFLWLARVLLGNHFPIEACRVGLAILAWVAIGNVHVEAVVAGSRYCQRARPAHAESVRRNSRNRSRGVPVEVDAVLLTRNHWRT